ncbi:sugar kinase [Geodermatophilus sp. SYSU D00703]
MSVKHDVGAADRFDLVSLGETMAAFIRNGEDGRYRLAAIGAESNVAVGMAQLGCRTRWISRLGADELGRHVAAAVSGHGVDLQVEWDETRVTGVAVKEVTPGGTTVRYYRSQSAARALTAAHVQGAGPTRWVHVTGVTPALSDSCAALAEEVVDRRTHRAGRVSFDVNYRPALWSGAAEAARVLVALARRADTVFIGDDEARSLLGTCDEDEVRRRLLTRDDQEVVLKRGAGPASLLTGDAVVTEPARPASVVDVTGAGDAFAAGYLAASCWGWAPRERLRLGHWLATRVIAVDGDLAPTLTRSERDRLLDAVRMPPPGEERTA